MKKLVISIDDAANTLSVCRSSIYNLGRKGQLKLVKMGARTGVTVESIETLVGANK